MMSMPRLCDHRRLGLRVQGLCEPLLDDGAQARDERVHALARKHATCPDVDVGFFFALVLDLLVGSERGDVACV